MFNINIDFETRSLLDIGAGAYKYASHPSTDVLCISYAVNGGESQLWTMGSMPPKDLLEMVRVPTTRLHAFNVGFERRIWDFVLANRYGWPSVPLEMWYDTQADALAMGFPADLKRCADALKVKFKKDASGTRLINLLSKPIKNTQAFREKKDFFKEYQELYEYCKQDVRAEMAVMNALEVHTTAEGQERDVWAMTERMNDRGVPVDVVLAQSLDTLCEESKEVALHKLSVQTDGYITTGGQTERMNKSLDYPLPNFQAGTLKTALTCPLLSDNDRFIMETRQKFSNVSTAKFPKMVLCAGEDWYVRDILQYHGAATGRYAGRGIQIQNYPSYAPEDAESIMDDIMNPELTLTDLEELYGPIQDLAKSMLRPTIHARPGDYIVCRDYSSIEARGTAWAVFDEEQLEAFRRGQDIYKVTASDMYGMSYGDITDESYERQAGKIAVLACGYQGGWKALRDFGVGYGIFFTNKEAHKIVTDFREARPQLVAAWEAFAFAAESAVRNPGSTYWVEGCQPCSFRMYGDHLAMSFPNGKLIWFPYACIKTSSFRYETPEGEYKWFERESLHHHKMIEGAWRQRSIHGGSLFQSFVQGICREIMVENMLGLESDGWPLNISVHDEIGSVVPEDFHLTPQQFEDTFTQVPEWAKGFPIKASGWEGNHFRK